MRGLWRAGRCGTHLDHAVGHTDVGLAGVTHGGRGEKSSVFELRDLGNRSDVVHPAKGAMAILGFPPQIHGVVLLDEVADTIHQVVDAFEHGLDVFALPLAGCLVALLDHPIDEVIRNGCGCDHRVAGAARCQVIGAQPMHRTLALCHLGHVRQFLIEEVLHEDVLDRPGNGFVDRQIDVTAFAIESGCPHRSKR